AAQSAGAGPPGRRARGGRRRAARRGPAVRWRSRRAGASGRRRGSGPGRRRPTPRRRRCSRLVPQRGRGAGVRPLPAPPADAAWCARRQWWMTRWSVGWIPVLFQDVVERRRMVRNFDPRPVPAEVRDRIPANGLRAPSAGFTQGGAFLGLEGPTETSRLWQATFADDEARRRFPWQGLFAAPLVVAVLSHKQAYLDRYAEP